MNLIGENVILRAIEIEDCNLLKGLINAPEIESQVGGKSFPVSSFAQENWIRSLPMEKNVLRYMVVNREMNKAAGTIVMNDIDYINGNAQIHIKLEQQFQRKGFGSEAIRLLMKYAFEELRLECVYALINEQNSSSRKVFEACGFEVEGRLRKRVFKNGNFQDQYLVSALRN